MSLTWKPRLVNTPTPIMSATTIAAATMTETECPPARTRLGHAGLPVSDAVMSGPSALGRRGHGASWRPPIQARLTRPKERWLTEVILYQFLISSFPRLITALRKPGLAPTITTRFRVDLEACSRDSFKCFRMGKFF